jgi:hypothetical protein
LRIDATEIDHPWQQDGVDEKATDRSAAAGLPKFAAPLKARLLELVAQFNEFSQAIACQPIGTELAPASRPSVKPFNLGLKRASPHHGAGIGNFHTH